MLILFFALVSQAHASIEFVAPKSYTLKTSLPPQIALKYDLGCASKFVKVLREEREDPHTREAVISLGVLVETDPSRACAGTREETVIAGHAYSGRAHRIELMSLYSTKAYSTRTYPDVLQARPSEYGSSKNLKCPIAVIPGQGLGPVQVGMQIQDSRPLG